MTASSIAEILAANNFSMDAWITGVPYRLIALEGDNNIEVDPKSTQFYFSSTQDCVYIRHTYPAPFRTTGTGLVTVVANGVENYLRPEIGGKEVAGIGKVHAVIFDDAIAGFYF